MPSNGVFYGAIAVLLALLIVSSSLALVYYGQYQQQVAANGRYVDDLNAALTRYRSLSRSYDASLRDYNITLSLLATAVANLNTSTPAYSNASVALPKLWSSYQTLAALGGSRVPAYSVQMMVNYGNGTQRWYNGTAVKPGWNAYVATLVVLDGRVQASWYPQYGEHFVQALDGVSSGQTNSWFVWVEGSSGWELSPTGADGVQVYNGSTFAWTLCGYDASFNPTCTP